MMMIFWLKYKSKSQKQQFLIESLNEFEKWPATRASTDGVLTWLVWVACLRGKRASVVGVGDVLAWVVILS